MRLRVVLLSLLAFWPVAGAFAVEPGEMLANPALEERARSAGRWPADADRDRKAWRIEEIPDEYMDLVRKAQAPEEAKGFNEEVTPGWTGR